MTVEQRTSRPLVCTRGSSPGSVMVEFALVLPLFFLILAGLVDYGLEIRHQTVLIEAARIGARAASLKYDAIAAGSPPAEASSIQTEIAIAAAKNALVQAGFNAGDYNFHVLNTDVAGVPMVRFSVYWKNQPRTLRAANFFRGCAVALFRVETQFPINWPDIPTPECS